MPWLKSPSPESVTLALAEQRTSSLRSLMTVTRCPLHGKLCIGRGARGWVAVCTLWNSSASTMPKDALLIEITKEELNPFTESQANGLSDMQTSQY